jgi:hypothetical protein
VIAVGALDMAAKIKELSLREESNPGQPVVTNKLNGTDRHWVKMYKVSAQKHLQDTGDDGTNAKNNIPEMGYKREDCIRPALLHGPVTASCLDGNEPSFSTKGVTVPN